MNMSQNLMDMMDTIESPSDRLPEVIITKKLMEADGYGYIKNVYSDGEVDIESILNVGLCPIPIGSRLTHDSGFNYTLSEEVEFYPGSTGNSENRVPSYLSHVSFLDETQIQDVMNY